MDLASIIGLVGCAAAVVYGIVSGDQGFAALNNFWDFSSFLITILGSIFCMLTMADSIPGLIASLKSIGLIMKTPESNEGEVIHTIIDLATAYGTSLGLDSTGLLLALLFTQIVAFPASLLFASLSKTQDTAKLIKICILAYFCIACFAIQLDNIVEFWILAGAVGCFQGGIQALSRSYYAKIIPDNASGEYFGLFDICGKGASFLGLLVVGIVTQYTGQQNLGVAALTFMFLIGYFLFAKAAKLEK